MRPRTPAQGKAGEAGLVELPDGSLVAPGAYEDRYGRGEKAPGDRGADVRTETERDRGRLGYSSALRRLAGVTQVISPDLAAARMHSRESHTHKVAMVARELAELVIRRARVDESVASLIFKAGGLDIAACEAAGLAHDLGHAPFGHAGENELHNLLRVHTPDGFEGNPQSFRIVTRLDGDTEKRTDMDLTNVTLCAILKYPWHREIADEKSEAPIDRETAGEEGVASSPTEVPDPVNAVSDDGEEASDQPGSTCVCGGAEKSSEAAPRVVEKPLKYGAYAEDRERYNLVRRKVMGEDFATNRRQSLEASIMDLADDIAYAVHDLEDFASAGMIDLQDVDRKLVDATSAVKDEPGAGRFSKSESTDPFTHATKKLRETYAGLFDDNEYFFALQRASTLVRQVTELAPAGSSLPVTLRDHLSGKIGDYFNSLEIDDNLPYATAAIVRLSVPSWHEVQVLKVMTRHWLIQSPQMGMIQRAQTRAIRTLFDSLVDWLSTPGTSETSIPSSLRDTLVRAQINLNKEKLGVLDERHYRAIGDYISGLSDSEALLRSNWFAGREIPGMTIVAEAF